jgi:hypothetical protein
VIGEKIGKPREAHPRARLDERSKLAEVETPEGPVRLWAAPIKTVGRCVWLEFRGEERAVTPCLPRGYQRQTGLAFAAEVFFLSGWHAGGQARLEQSGCEGRWDIDLVLLDRDAKPLGTTPTTTTP